MVDREDGNKEGRDRYRETVIKTTETIGSILRTILRQVAFNALRRSAR